MSPVDFPESNVSYGAPPDLDGAQVATIRAYQGTAEGGSLDGVAFVTTAWKPDAAELALLNQGEPIFLTFLGGLPPHMVTTDFNSATHPR